MLGRGFRPWGQIDWVLGKIPQRQWSVLGTLNTEHRSLAVWEWVRTKHLETRSLFIHIENTPSRFTTRIDAILQDRYSTIRAIGEPQFGIERLPLFADDQSIVETVERFIEKAEENAILDISAMPKRFFFPFVHKLLDSTKLRNLLVTYTSPERYYEGELAEDHVGLLPLPLFRNRTIPEPKVEMVIIGIGYMPLGIADLLEKHKYHVDVKTLFPFPPGPPNFQRNWKFLNAIRRDYPVAARELIRVEARDTPDAFDYILALTDNGRSCCEFGPYGPKPLSLAMCLFARLTKSVVRYTQPKVYHPEYSTGVRTVNGQPLINTYCLRLNGRDFYTI